MSTGEKFVQMGIAIALFIGVVGVVLVLADRVKSRRGEVLQTTAFVLPAVLMISFGLLYPAVRTIYESFRNPTSTEFVGNANYQEIFGNEDLLQVLTPRGWQLVTDGSAVRDVRLRLTGRSAS